ncbi:MAG: hypothetical protein ACRD8Z_04400, partial [Nitrososphaeraceae archaeon]
NRESLMKPVLDNSLAVKYRVSCKLSKMGDNLVIWIPKDKRQKLWKLKGKPLIITIESLSDQDTD